MISIFKNVTSSTPFFNTTPKIMMDYIKYNKENLLKIEAIRSLSIDEYKIVKKTRPAITWAGTFSKRNNHSLKECSSLMYFDIDNFDDVNSILEIPEVYSLWKSLSGKGIGFLIKVKNLNSYNFISTFNSFINNYELPVDKLRDISRLNIVSGDSDLYINNNCLSYNSVDPVIEIKKSISPIFKSKDNVLETTLKYGYNYIDGQRHAFAVYYFSYANMKGIPLDTSLSNLSQVYQLSHDTIKTATDIYSRYAFQFNQFNQFCRL